MEKPPSFGTGPLGLSEIDGPMAVAAADVAGSGVAVLLHPAASTTRSVDDSTDTTESMKDTVALTDRRNHRHRSPGDRRHLAGIVVGRPCGSFPGAVERQQHSAWWDSVDGSQLSDTKADGPLSDAARQVSLGDEPLQRQHSTAKS